jgi:LEA14-like dessication related protein
MHCYKEFIMTLSNIAQRLIKLGCTDLYSPDATTLRINGIEYTIPMNNNIKFEAFLAAITTPTVKRNEFVIEKGVMRL